MSEARSEHEWVTHDGVPLRVRSTNTGNVLEIGTGQGRWSPLTSNAPWVVTKNASVHALMDELAKLAVLAPPGGDDDADEAAERPLDPK